MPYLCAVFDDATQAVIRQAASRFAGASAFTFDEDLTFHIPLIGSLHVYTKEEIYAAVQEGGQATTSPIQGVFSRWELHGTRLRVLASLASGHEGLARVSAKLPRGKEWRGELYVDVGTVAEINPSERDAFLDAVVAAFPITEASTFSCPFLDYNDSRGPGNTKPAVATKQKAALNPQAKPFRPAAVKAHAKPPAQPTGSTHMKWVRPGASEKMRPLDWETKWETGCTSNRRPAAIGKRRRRPMQKLSGRLDDFHM